MLTVRPCLTCTEPTSRPTFCGTACAKEWATANRHQRQTMAHERSEHRRLLVEFVLRNPDQAPERFLHLVQ